jgi:ABC-type transporter Mla subunit MlaD
MAKQRNAVRAGIFMLVSVALVLFVIIAISGASRFTQSFVTYPVAFTLKDNVGGLQPGDDVRIGGLKVGSVESIQLRTIKSPTGEDTPRVIVYIDLPSRYHIATDADIHVEVGITGPPSVNIDSFGAGPLATSSDYLTGQPDALAILVANLKIASGKLNSDLDRFGSAADSITATGTAASSTLLDVKARVPLAVERYHALVNSAVGMLDTVKQFLGPSSSDFHDTLANLHKISGNVKDKLPPILDKFDLLLTKTNGALDHANGALVDVQKVASNLRDATGTLRSVLVDNQSRLNGIIASLKETGDNLKYASMEIRHSPWRLLYQPKEGEVTNLNTYDSIRQFAQGADNLDDASQALRDILKDPNADPAQVKKLINNLNDSFAKFQQVQSTLWKQISP